MSKVIIVRKSDTIVQDTVNKKTVVDTRPMIFMNIRSVHRTITDKGVTYVKDYGLENQLKISN
jgi:hypothetical protein